MTQQTGVGDARGSSAASGGLGDRIEHEKRDARTAAREFTDDVKDKAGKLASDAKAAAGEKVEEAQHGPHARKLREGAEDLAERGLKGAGAVASKTYEAVRDEADRQGLKPGAGETVASRVGEVVKAAADTVDQTVREELAPRQDQDIRVRT